MGRELIRVDIEGGLTGVVGTSSFLLANQMPRQGILSSYNEKGLAQREHIAELDRQKQQLLEQPSLFLFDDKTHYLGSKERPTTAIRTYLEYRSILP